MHHRIERHRRRIKEALSTPSLSDRGEDVSSAQPLISASSATGTPHRHRSPPPDHCRLDLLRLCVAASSIHPRRPDLQIRQPPPPTPSIPSPSPAADSTNRHPLALPNSVDDDALLSTLPQVPPTPHVATILRLRTTVASICSAYASLPPPSTLAAPTFRFASHCHRRHPSSSPSSGATPPP
uniref:Uncharacterized protein n=1 Tax=Oryza sativa subsp. japonica TaxID=39947 RepID=Q6Z8A3_ORYSJ|nr:hypothetical protein [Oryza sativa Japonica Group]BAD07896.1 hypothetical protein [Oryza sativa Japonica Group]